MEGLWFFWWVSILGYQAWAITNNADLIWYGKDSDEPQSYHARNPIPEGLIKARKIVVNQKVPVLYEVKFAFFDNLQALLIDECGVKEIRPNTFKDLKPLRNLSLTRNAIQEIQAGVFNSVQIGHLNLTHNRISIIATGAFDNMPALTTLLLDFNELKNWNSDWYRNSGGIKTVSMTHNFLEDLPAYAFKNLANGANVYLSYNKIASFQQDTFGTDGRLFDELFLDWNEIEEVDGRTFSGITSLKFLNLDGNRLQCFPKDFVSAMLNITGVFSVRENPITCECRMELENTKIMWSKNKTC